MDLLIINGHDYSKFILHEGYGWARNDLDSEKSTRTKDGVMRRDRITTKRKLTFTLSGMTKEQVAQLDEDLQLVSFTVSYMDLHGQQTREFYCANFEATMVTATHNGPGCWATKPFSMTEI